jgi:hypothetical protein
MIERRRRQFWSSVVCVALGLASGGCFGDSSMVPVSGLVLLDGRPLSAGAIDFYRVGKEPSAEASRAGSLVTNGRFSLSRESGLSPGRYRISVYSAGQKKPGRGGVTVPGDDEKAAREFVPRKYNSDSKLEFEIADSAIKEMRISITSR